MECRVEFDYEAQEEDELTLKKGDIITDVVEKMDGWWEGTLGGKTGMFPDNFVKKIEKSVPPQPDEDNSKNSSIVRSNSKKMRQLKALFSYTPEQEDELRLEVGDIIEFISEVEEGWWTGKLKGRKGIFPSNFVTEYEPPKVKEKPRPDPVDDFKNELNSKVITANTDLLPSLSAPPPPTSEPPDDEPAPELPPKPVREQAKCYFHYKAQNEDELTLNVGDVVTIINKNCEDEGWWRGELNGKVGLFPDNFVKIITPNDTNHIKNSSSSPSSFVSKITSSERFKKDKNIEPVSKRDSIETKTNGSSVVDGGKPSKAVLEDQESVSSKVAKFSKLNFNPQGKVTQQQSPISSGPLSPKSLPTITKRDSMSKEDDLGAFNSIERGDKLNHLTAGRAKAPKRRPPSTLITKDNEEEEMNGSCYSQESIDSPMGHSTPFNSTLNSTNSPGITPSNSVADTPQNSYTAAKENDSNISASSAKSKKVIPWMQELQQKQDQKRGLNSSQSFNSSSINNANSSTSLPPVPSNLSSPKEVVAKAPPLPAKPSSLTNNVSSDKSPTVPSPTSVAPIVAGRAIKKPAPPLYGNTFNHSGHDANVRATGDNPKAVVSFEEFAKLRDRVAILETELETVRQQLKVLIDRELSQPHIV